MKGYLKHGANSAGLYPLDEANGSDEEKVKALKEARNELGDSYAGGMPYILKNSRKGTLFLSDDQKKKGYTLLKFAQGGMVDFTGPAWVDGTKSRPEAFLNADDTKRIGEAAKLLSDLPLLDNPRTQTNEISNTNVGDTTFEIHINVENISSDYDVDQAVERVKQDIADAAQYAGSNVILKKK